MVSETKGPSASVVNIETRAALAVKRPEGANAPVPPPKAESSSVSLTSDAKTLASLEKAVKEAPVVDAARVQGLQKAIADGSYQVEPAAVAERLMRMESLLATTQAAPAGNADT